MSLTVPHVQTAGPSMMGRVSPGSSTSLKPAALCGGHDALLLVATPLTLLRPSRLADTFPRVTRAQAPRGAKTPLGISIAHMLCVRAEAYLSLPRTRLSCRMASCRFSKLLRPSRLAGIILWSRLLLRRGPLLGSSMTQCTTSPPAENIVQPRCPSAVHMYRRIVLLAGTEVRVMRLWREFLH